MGRARLYIGIMILSLAALLMAACTGESSLAIKGVAEARNAALAYLHEYEAQNAPNQGIEWQEVDITPAGIIGSVQREFISEPLWSSLPAEWTVTVSYPVVPPENTVYEVVVASIKLGWHWKGTVKADGSVTEVSPFKQMSKEESQAIAEDFLRSSPTFVFDGIEETLTLEDTLTARCPYCWVFIFEFESKHAASVDRARHYLQR